MSLSLLMVAGAPSPGELLDRLAMVAGTSLPGELQTVLFQMKNSVALYTNTPFLIPIILYYPGSLFPKTTLNTHPDTTHVDVHALSSGDNIEVPLVSNVFRNAVRADGFDRRDSMPFPELLKKHANFKEFLKRNKDSNHHVLTGTHTSKATYTDQYLLIAISDESVDARIADSLPRSCKKEVREFMMINSWILIPRVEDCLAYKIGRLHSRMHGSLVVNYSKEEKAFRDIFNYIPLKTIDGAVEMEDIDVKIINSATDNDLEALSAELGYVYYLVVLYSTWQFVYLYSHLYPFTANCSHTSLRLWM